MTPAIRAYAEGEPVTFSFGRPQFSVELPIEPDGTFSANVNLHDGFFREHGMDAGMATAAISHEVEHLREFLVLTRTPDGARAWREHTRKLEADARLHALDNMVDDVRMNRTVIQRAPSLRPGMERIYTNYAFPDPDLQHLPSGEANPLHLQFAQSLLRDAMLPDEPAAVAPDVREAQSAVLERVNAERKTRGLAPAKSFHDVVRQITDPSLSPMSRLALTRRYLEPAYQALYREDLEKEQQRQSGGGNDRSKKDAQGSSGNGDKPHQDDASSGGQQPKQGTSSGKQKKRDENQQQRADGHGNTSQTADENGRASELDKKARSDGAKPSPSPSGPTQTNTPQQASGSDTNEPPKEPEGPSEPQEHDGAPSTADPEKKRSIADAIRDLFAGKKPKDAAGDAKTTGDRSKDAPDLSKLRPEDVFPEAYREHAKHRPTPVSEKEWEQLAKDLQEKAARGLKPQDPNDPRVQEKRAFFESNAADHPTEEDWKNFQRWHQLRDAAYAIRDANGRPVIEELRDIFANILSHRRRKRPSPKAPQEEGDALSPEHLVEAWLSLKAGEETAEVWTVERTKERPAERVGVFDISIAGDLSESMLHGGKDTAQRQATVLLLAALEEFRREIAYLEGDLREDLAVRTEAWGFGNGPHLLKPLTNRLEPIHCARVAGGMTPNSAYGTHDYTVLQKIREAIESDPVYAAKLKPRDGRNVPEIRRIVLVLTDGASGNRTKCMQEVAALRALGVKVIAIGITADGKPAEQTYAPDGRVCETASDLALTTGVLLADLLKNPEVGYSDMNYK